MKMLYLYMICFLFLNAHLGLHADRANAGALRLEIRNLLKKDPLANEQRIKDLYNTLANDSNQSTAYRTRNMYVKKQIDSAFDVARQENALRIAQEAAQKAEKELEETNKHAQAAQKREKEKLAQEAEEKLTKAAQAWEQLTQTKEQLAQYFKEKYQEASQHMRLIKERLKKAQAEKQLREQERLQQEMTDAFNELSTAATAYLEKTEEESLQEKQRAQELDARIQQTKSTQQRAALTKQQEEANKKAQRTKEEAAKLKQELAQLAPENTEAQQQEKVPSAKKLQEKKLSLKAIMTDAELDRYQAALKPFIDPGSVIKIENLATARIVTTTNDQIGDLIFIKFKGEPAYTTLHMLIEKGVEALKKHYTTNNDNLFIAWSDKVKPLANNLRTFKNNPQYINAQREIDLFLDNATLLLAGYQQKSNKGIVQRVLDYFSHSADVTGAAQSTAHAARKGIARAAMQAGQEAADVMAEIGTQAAESGVEEMIDAATQAAEDIAQAPSIKDILELVTKDIDMETLYIP
jgi:hypothetical protein